jgi:hypothetical protein
MDDINNDLTRLGLQLIGVAGGLTKQPDVNQMPFASMDPWRAFKTSSGAIHLVGYCLERGEGRASSAIVCIDATARRCLTASGRTYCLVGKPRYNGDAEFVWGRFKEINGLTEVLDISETLFKLEKELLRK